MRILSLFGIAFMYACTTSTAGDVKNKISSAQNSSHKVLIELFTSQGCSSCPSADNLLSKMAGADTNLIILSFHVDYWDNLGWKDVFSNHNYTLRQQQYVQALNAESVYTPQAVVQGQYEMVGSNKTGISNALAKAREENNSIILQASTSVNNNLVTVNSQVNKISAKQQLVIVLVQTHTSTAIARGENSGVQLAGYNVVRSFTAAPLTKNNDNTQLSLPTDLMKDNASVVVFIQDLASKKIVAVTSVKI